jgi:hypothetical protein
MMSGHGYDSGRLNLPFVGLCSFGKYPYQPDWNAIDADFAILGAPFDFGTQFRAGARFGPRGIREASTLFSFGHAGAYDHEDDVTYLENDRVRIVDIGDADIIHTDTIQSHANIEAGVRAILKAGAVPMTTFFRIQMPLILPGVVSGGLFAFITSFDEVVVVLFVGSASQKTLPWQMFTGLREQISPTILAVATILVAISIALLTTVEILRRRSERLRGITPS